MNCSLNQAVCPSTSAAVEEIMSQVTFKILVLLCMLLSLGGFIANTILLVGLSRTSLVQANIKLLLINVSVAAIVLCGSEIVHKSLMIWRSSTKPSQMIQGHQCMYEALPKNISMYSLALLIVVVAIERVVATKNFRSYESQPKFFGWICLVISWVCPAIVGIYGAIEAPSSFHLSFCFTILMYSNKLLVVYMGFDVGIGLLSLFMYLTIVHINRKKLTIFLYNQAQLSLSARYQLRNNIEMTNILIPSVILRVVAYTISNISYIYTMKYMTNSLMKEKATVILLGNLVTSIYSFGHPVSVLITSKRNLKLLSNLKLCGHNVAGNNVSPEIRLPNNFLKKRANGSPYIGPP